MTEPRHSWGPLVPKGFVELWWCNWARSVRKPYPFNILHRKFIFGGNMVGSFLWSSSLGVLESKTRGGIV